jgi:hypothetical protein
MAGNPLSGQLVTWRAIRVRLQAGSFRWSAAKPKTTSAGAPVTVSPVILVMPGLTPARRDAG